MTQSEAVSRVAKDIQRCFEISTNDMATLIPFFQELYAIGFDEGRMQGAHRIKIQQISDGNVIQEFDSITQAAYSIKGDKSHISKVINGKRKYAYGFEWKIVKPTNN
jgi:hypothetical protein